MNTTENTLETLAVTLGITLTSSAPRPHVEPEWLAIAYDCTVSRNGRIVWMDSYRVGLGCVREYWKAAVNHPHLWEHRDAIETLVARPMARLYRREVHAAAAAAAAAVALEFKVKPSLSDVLHSLLLDGSADFDALTFEQWCADFGYDMDSRKALETYEACCDTGRRLRAAFTPDELSALREAASSH